MEENKDNFGFGENIPEQDDIDKQFPIEDDADALEPFDDSSEHREIDANDPEDLRYWAQQFQISVDDLKAAIVLNGPAVRDVKKYLSV